VVTCVSVSVEVVSVLDSLVDAERPDCDGRVASFSKVVEDEVFDVVLLVDGISVSDCGEEGLGWVLRLGLSLRCWLGVDAGGGLDGRGCDGVEVDWAWRHNPAAKSTPAPHVRILARFFMDGVTNVRPALPRFRA